MNFGVLVSARSAATAGQWYQAVRINYGRWHVLGHVLGHVPGHVLGHVPRHVPCEVFLDGGLPAIL